MMGKWEGGGVQKKWDGRRDVGELLRDRIARGRLEMISDDWSEVCYIGLDLMVFKVEGIAFGTDDPREIVIPILSVEKCLSERK
jgi:hypothetical protein